MLVWILHVLRHVNELAVTSEVSGLPMKLHVLRSRSTGLCQAPSYAKPRWIIMYCIYDYKILCITIGNISGK